MIQVSNEFKKAIKEPERRIKGYVEVLYDLPSVSITPTTNMTSTYTPTSEISNGIRVENLYGSVDYLPLDGSYLTMGATNTNIGFISDELFEDLTNPTITLSFSSTTVKGITMYFRNNTPTDLTVNYSDGTSDTITNNERDIVQVIFEEEKTLTSVQVAINDVMYSDRKIYCMEIDLGVTQVYKDQDLIEFTVDEEVNKLVEEVPINETNITLNNMTDLFNPLNPKGIVPYLSENTVIKPYIGVLTENLGVEYVKMGEFYFDSYTNNSDATTTLVGKNILKQMEGKTIINGLSRIGTDVFIDTSSSTYDKTFKGIIENSGFEIDINTSQQKMSNLNFNNTIDIKEYIKSWCLLKTTIFYADRNNLLKVRDLESIKETITKSELINDAEFKYLDKINTINVLRKQKFNDSEISNQEITYKMFDNQEFELAQNEQIFYVEKPIGIYLSNFNLSVTGANSVQVMNDNNFYAILKIIGVAGNTARVTATRTSYYTKPTSTIKNDDLGTYTNKQQGEKEVKIEVYQQLLVTRGNVVQQGATEILNYAPSYEMSFDYNGDPSLEAGDYIDVETPYGYKPLFIQKNRFKFDGGLEGSIEGVE